MSNLYEQLRVVKKYNLDNLKKIEKDIKNWGIIAQSEEIEWNEEIIIEYSSELHSYWKSLLQNKSINLSYDFIKKIRHYINWDIFSQYFSFNGFYTFKDIYSFLNEFKSEINWLKLSENENLDWGIFFEYDLNGQNRIIDEFKEFWSFSALSLNKSIHKNGYAKNHLISKYRTKLNWKKLSEIREDIYMFNPELIEEFKEEINWFSLSIADYLPQYYFYKKNSNFLEKYKQYIVWECFAKNKLSKNIIIEYENYFEGTFYNQLSANKNINFDIELIDRYKDKWDWTKLIQNEGIIWDIKKVTYFREDIFKYANLQTILYNNKNIEFDVEILKEYSKNWSEVYFRSSTKNFEGYFEGLWFIYSDNNNIDFKIINEFGKYLNVAKIIKNANLIWNEELIISILNIEFGDEYEEFEIKNNDDTVYKQNVIDSAVGFKRNKENIIDFMMTQDHIKNVLIKSLFRTLLK